ncbi:MAG: MMPL family transporter [Candidatus Hydrogenedens sp.]|nr:MMPL family transporter [Candidatus Hydrogenedens sp.]
MVVTDAAINRSTTVLVSLLLITFAGFTSYFGMPREKYPEIIIPRIIVTTTYEGVSPSDIETLLTIPIERELTGINDVREITSYSAEGISSIQIEFEPSIDIDTALQKVRDKVDQAKSELPTEADDATIREINFSEFPIMYLSLRGKVGLPMLTQVADELEDEIESIRGVLDVKVTGKVEREIQIIVDPTRAGEYGVSMADLVQLARVENVNTPAGSVELAGAKYLIRVPGEFESAAEIEDLVVKTSPQGVVYMRDIARVVDGFKEIETMSRLDDEEAVTLAVSKRSGESIIAISDKVAALVAESDGVLPAGIQLDVIMDQSVEIRDMIAELENSILSGLILVLAVIFVFLGFMNAIFVALAIPVSMLLTFIGLHLIGTTLNMVVLFSLMLALGMLVDNGIVIVENIYRHMQLGLGRIEASKRGASEVAWPIAASTVTTVAAFAPMFFWPGIWGEFMKYLPQTLTFSLLGSLFVGLIVNPALASIFMRGPRKKATETKLRQSFIITAYIGLLRFALRWRLPTVTLAATLLVVISITYITQAVIEFEPTTEPVRAVVDVDGPQGQSLDVTDNLIRTIESRLGDLSGKIDYTLASVGSLGAFSNDGGGGDRGESNIGRVTIDFPKLSESKELPSHILESVRGRFGDLTGADITVEEEEEGPETGPPVNVEISGPDFDVLVQLAQEVQDIVKTVPNTFNVRDDYDQGKPEIRVNVDRQQALMLGLNTQFIGQTVQAAINGRKAGDYREGDEEYDVVVRFPESFKKDLSNIEAMTLVNLNGQAIPFSAVADLQQASGVGFIRRIDRKRTITVSAQVDEQRTGPEVLADVSKALENFRLPPGYSLRYTGENEDLEETQAFLFNAFIIALFLIALILIAQFNSIIQPLIIMSSVILSLAGVFLGLYLFDMRFSVLMTGIGCISLAGVVVNNAIVLIDFINQRRAEGATAEEAIVDAGTTRFRPVMLTAVTTILGLIPMAMGVSYDFFNGVWIVGGESSQYWGPMATAVIFGLAFATVLTLVVVPVLYSLTSSVSDFFSMRTLRKLAGSEAPAAE